MASVQTEHGFTRFDNRLLEALCRLNISSSELRILLYIIRRTFGYNRTSAEISLSEIAGAVGLTNPNTSRALKKLRGCNLIVIKPNKGNRPQTLSVVENYDEWNVPETASDRMSIIRNDNSAVIKNDNTAVIENDNTSVIRNDNSTVIRNDNDTYKEKIKESNKEIIKERKPYGRNRNVMLSDEEHHALTADYGSDNVGRYIDRMDSWMQSRNVTRLDCASELRKWMERDGAAKRNGIDYDAVYGQFVNDFDNIFDVFNGGKI